MAMSGLSRSAKVRLSFPKVSLVRSQSKVSSVICMSPRAPTSERASGSKWLSTWMVA